MRAGGHGVEPICEVLCEQGLAVAPRSYRAWKTLPACERDKSDDAVLDKLRHVRTGGPKGQPLPELVEHGVVALVPLAGRQGLPGPVAARGDREALLTQDLADRLDPVSAGA